MPKGKQSRVTPELTKFVELCWKDPGLSTTDIGNQLAKKFPEYDGETDRNSISGLVYRLRAKGADLPQRTPKGPRPHRSTPFRPGKNLQRVARSPGVDPVRGSVTGMLLSGNGIPNEPLSTYDGAFQSTPGQKLKSFFELGDDECRWPFERGGVTMYCGNKGGKPYCAAHNRKQHK